VKATSVVTEEPIRLSPRSRFRAAMILAMAAMHFKFLCFRVVAAVLVHLLGPEHASAKSHVQTPRDFCITADAATRARIVHYVFFQTGGMALALYPRRELAKDANVASDSYGFSGISIAYNARGREEVDSVLAQAEAAGAKLLKPGQVAFWGGYSGYFPDPDGFLWEIAWNPSFRIAEDGSVRIPD
jgi:uncharacterized protein